MTSNKLVFKVVSGGIVLTTTFDYTIDYVVGQNILFPGPLPFPPEFVIN